MFRKENRLLSASLAFNQISERVINPANGLEENGPADPEQRIVSLDILRGVAVLGILLLNIYDFAAPTSLFDVPVGLSRPAFTGWHASLDNFIFWLTWLFAEGKMRSLFSILFGAGVIMLTERYDKTGRSNRTAGIFYRRNLWLLFVGLCHGFLLFPYDILVDYALLGMCVLFFLRRITARTLMLTGMVIWIVLGTAGIINAVGVSETIRADAQLRAARQAGTHITSEQKSLIANAAREEQSAATGTQQLIEAGHLSYWEGRMDRFNNEIGFLMFKASGLFISYLGAMIFGMGLYKSGFLTNQKPASHYFLMMLAGYTITFILTGLGLWKLQYSGYSGATFAQWLWKPYCIQVAAGTMGNLSLLLLLLRVNFFRKLFSPLAAVGRMALSNYILTSLICGWVFSWGPLKFFGELEFYQWYCIVAVVWCINLLFSCVWLSYFRFGPVEWLWRFLTYYKRATSHPNA